MFETSGRRAGARRTAGRGAILALLAMGGGGLAGAEAQAATHSVPGDFATITAAVSAAAPGDVIVVGPGTHSASTTGESFPIFVTQDLTIAGAGLGLTILDGENGSRIFDFDAPSGGRISGFTITNGVSSRGSGVIVRQGSPEIDGNFIHRNGAEFAGAGVLVQGASTPHVHHNVFWDNYDTVAGGVDPHAILYQGTAAGVCEHNVIGKTDGNGLLASADAQPSVRHNIFVENGIPSPNRGRGICWLGTQPPIVFHNLFWDNQIAAILWGGGPGDLSGAAANDVSGTDLVYGNLDGDPAFTDAGAFDFTLTAGSPAIDAGDPALPLDPDGTVADIGAFFFDQSTTSVLAGERGAIGEFFARPNPVRESSAVRLSLDREAPVSVRLIDVRGRRVRELHGGALSAGSHRFDWDGRDDAGRRVASGVYFAVVETDRERASTPLVVVR